MEQELYRVSLATKGAYDSANRWWGNVTGSTPVDEWQGPGVYAGDGWYADYAGHVPMSALRKVG